MEASLPILPGFGGCHLFQIPSIHADSEIYPKRNVISDAGAEA